jgi:MFS family permease
VSAAAIPISAYPSRASAYYTLAMLTIASFLSFLDRTILNLVVGPIEHDLHITDTQMGILQGFTFTIFFTLTAIPLGWIVDRTARRNLMIIGIALWSVMTILSGLSNSYGELLLARIGVGVGEATLIPASVSMLPDYFPPNQRGRAFGVLSVAAIVGTSGSYFLGGLILHALAGPGPVAFPLLGNLAVWQATFVIVGLPGLVMALLLFTVREPKRLGEPQAANQTSAESFLRYVKRRPMAFVCVWGAYTMTTYVAYCFISWAPTLMARNFGTTPGQFGNMVGLPSALIGLAACLLTGYLGDRMTMSRQRGGRFRITIIWAFGMIPVLLLLTLSHNFAFAAVGYVFGTFFNSLTFGSAYAVMQEIVPPRMRGRATSSWYFFNSLIANGLGPLIPALATEKILGAQSLLGLGIILASAPAILLGFVFPWLGMGPFEKARADAAAATQQ